MANNSELDTLSQELSKLVNGQQQTYQSKDERFWNIKTDKAENGYAVIRFLDKPEGEDLPVVRFWEHSFKGPTGLWYIENCLTTFQKADPCAELNSRLWNSTADDSSPARKQAREQKRKLRFISNILVVKDPAQPENEGKVFLFKYGKVIYEKLMSAMNPQFDDEERFNPFSFKEGANFKIKVMKVDGYRNYDKSEFDKRGPIGDDTVIKKIRKQQYGLQEFLGPKYFKSYEELKEKLEKVLDLETSAKPVKSERTATRSAPKAARVTEDDEFTSGSIDDSVLADLLSE